jgi:hypothetical protein
VVAVLVRMDVELLGADRLDSEFVLRTETNLGTQAVDLADIDKLPADVVADLLGSLAAGGPDSLVAVGSGIEIEVGFPGGPGADLHGIPLGFAEVTDLGIPETGSHLGAEDRLGPLAQGDLMAYVGSLLPASEQPALHHYRFVPAHIEKGDGDGGAP